MEGYILIGIIIIIWIVGIWLFRRDLDNKIEKEQRAIKSYHQYYEDTNERN